MRAIMVCVDYQDLLAVTLPYNRHHFGEVHVITDERCYYEVRHIADANDVSVWHTQLFYEGGASFNKWAALEWGLDRMGREGWLCLMDADVLWPKWVDLDAGCLGGSPGYKIGNLITPLRRMAPWPVFAPSNPASVFGMPYERTWGLYPIHRNVNEWAGYSQIFHANDSVLGPPPWHEIDWKHAGGADSIFQRKWSAERKVRPPWEVLHLGEAGQNWYGRVSPLADGTVLERTEEKREMIDRIWSGRRTIREKGGSEADAFRPEKLD